MNYWARLVSLHPGWITLIWLMPLPLHFLSNGSTLGRLAGLVALLTTIAWNHAVYVAARAASSDRLDQPPDRSWVYGLSAILLVGQLLVGELWPAAYETLAGPPWRFLEFPLAVVFLAGWWFSASAFAGWKNGGPPSFDARLGWFLAFLYTPITVWVIRPHLLRLRAELDERSDMQG